MEFSTFKSLSFFFFLLGLTAAQVEFQQLCQDVTVVQNFDLNRYLGIWYKYESYPTYFERGGICAYANYTWNENGTIAVFNSNYKPDIQQRTASEAYAYSEGDPTVGKLSVKFPLIPSAPYWVLDTDYDNYAVVWGCTNLQGNPPLSRVFTWFLVRDKNPDPETIQIGEAVFDSNGVDRSFMVKGVQHGCDWY